MTGAVVPIGRVVAGVLMLGLGAVGLFLPFLQGVLFLIIGLTLLSSESVYARRCLEWLRSRRLHWPRTAKSGGDTNGRERPAGQ
jgi:uncharacterized membrane protein YbaN (DUF454 family)